LNGNHNPPGQFRPASAGAAFRAVLLGLALATGGISQSHAAAPNPVVEGPIAATSSPGSGVRDYPFFATDRDLKGIGYIEEEFFISGTANQYDIPVPINPPAPPGTTAPIVSSGHPYKTRMVVRRPADSRQFNGVVVVEWTNVTAGRDSDVDWFQTASHLTRAGYAYVSVSAQNAGVAALKTWSSRYSTLDVTAGGMVAGDALSYDIYSQAAQAVRSATGVRPLGTLSPRFVLAIGESQSAARLAAYINGVHPLHEVVDALILHSSGAAVRADLKIPAWKVLNETDVFSQFVARQPDTDRFRTWEVTGTSG
jgi:Alpha/beta hydrolase domain